MRALCIGREVTFKVDYAVPSIHREFGTVFVNVDGVQENAAMHLVSRGLACTRTASSANPTHQSPLHVQLEQAEQAAKAKGLGIHAKDPKARETAVRTVSATPLDTRAACDAKGADGNAAPLQCMVEAVLNASTLRVTLLPSFQSAVVALAGVQAPKMGKTARPAPKEAAEGGQQQGSGGGGGREATPPEPLAPEAKHFVESRVLQRNVTVVPEGVDKYDQLQVTVLYSEGAGSGAGKEHTAQLAQQVLSAGLGKVADWSANYLQPLRRERLRAAERQAKAGRQGLWKGYTAPQAAAAAAPAGGAFGGKRSFQAEVAEVLSGDMVAVRDPATGAEMRLALASVRAPRLGNPRREGDAGQPHGKEAKEFLRSRLIGAGAVRVDIEYSRKVGGGGARGADKEGGAEKAPQREERMMTFASLFLPAKGEGEGATGANVAEMVVVRGLATVVNHRNDDERSSQYEALLTAQDRAKKGKKGVWSSREPAPERMNDMSSAGLQQCKSFLPFLQRSGKLPCVVEHVISAHRLRVRCDKESCVFVCSLAGVRAPAKGEKGSAEAMALARRLALQHDAVVTVDACDNRTGAFLASVEIQPAKAKGGDSINLSAELLKAGLCKLVGPESRRNPALASLEMDAKARRVGVWEGYEEPAKAEEADAAQGGAQGAAGARGGGSRGPVAYRAHVTEVISGAMCYLRLEGVVPGGKDEGNDKNGGKFANELEAVQEGLAALSTGAAPEGYAPSVGVMCAGRFTADDQWYRVCVERVDRQALTNDAAAAAYDCFFVDFGNAERLPAARLRPLPAEAMAVPPLAQPAALDALKVPAVGEEYGDEAAQLLADLTAGREFECCVESSGRAHEAGLSKARGGRGSLLRVTLREAGAARADKKGSTKEDEGEGEASANGSGDGVRGPSVNGELLAAGLARVDERALRRRSDVRAKLLAHQDEAKKARRAMWQYGDAGSDDD